VENETERAAAREREGATAVATLLQHDAAIILKQQM